MKGRGGRLRRAPFSCWHRAPRGVNPALGIAVSLGMWKALLLNSERHFRGAERRVTACHNSSSCVV